MTIKNRVIVIFKKFWKLKWLRIPVLTFLFLYLCFQYNFLWLMGSMPSVEELKDPKLPVASELYAANGELIGLAFDGNYEALSHKLTFDKDLNRTICVDIRYVLWCIDKLGGAEHLIKELKLVK